MISFLPFGVALDQWLLTAKPRFGHEKKDSWREDRNKNVKRFDREIGKEGRHIVFLATPTPSRLISEPQCEASELENIDRKHQWIRQRIYDETRINKVDGS